MKCDVCGKNLVIPNKKETTCCMFSLSSYNDVDKPEEVVFMECFMGPYEVGRTYNICGECTLRAFGVKPPIERKDEAQKQLPICKTCLEDQGLPVAVPCKVSQHKINEVAYSTSDNTDIPKCLCGECKIPCIHNDK